MKADLFKPITPNMIYAKILLFGSMGSGKSFTATVLGLLACKHFKIPINNIAYLDSEGRAHDIQEAFGNHLNFRLNHLATQNFDDLMDSIEYCERQNYVLIIDSLTVFWKEFVAAFLKKMGRTKLQLDDHERIKTKWRIFVNAMMSGKCHIIMCAREQAVFEETLAAIEEGSDEDENSPKKSKLMNVGTRAAVEKELAYEPTLVIRADKIESRRGGVKRSLFVVKDSRAIMDSQRFNLKTYTSGKSPEERKQYAINCIRQIDSIFDMWFASLKAVADLPGAQHEPFKPAPSAVKIWEDDKISRPNYGQQSAILLERIENDLILIAGDGRAAASKLLRLRILEHVFKTNAWAEIQIQSVATLEYGQAVLEWLRKIVDAKPEGLALDANNVGELIEKAIGFALSPPASGDVTGENAFFTVVTNALPKPAHKRPGRKSALIAGEAPAAEMSDANSKVTNGVGQVSFV